jgi:hypothetical protein
VRPDNLSASLIHHSARPGKNDQADPTIFAAVSDMQFGA